MLGAILSGSGKSHAAPTNALISPAADPGLWPRDAIWYQIFPERFRNGDVSNDPTAADVGASTNWSTSPWTNDWYALQPGEEPRHGNFYSVAGERRYGGDLQGIIDELDYLAGLGINTIYLNPIFAARSNHKYNATCLHHVDKNFGPDPRGDAVLMHDEDFTATNWAWSAADKLFLKLIRQAHARHLRVVIDGVFNHVGTDFGPFQDVVARQQNSKYTNWFKILCWDNPATTQNEFDYEGWWGYKSLPELRQDENGLVAGPRDYIFQITRRWMAPNGNPRDGVDGWRLDVANQIAHPFWRDWRKLVKSINSNAIIVGEIWTNAAPWLQGDEFDSVMNYRFAMSAVKFFVNTGTNQLSPSQFDRELAGLRADYPDTANFALLNLFDSHDTDRLASMIKNPNRAYDRDATPQSNPQYDVTKPAARDRDIQKLMALFQATYPGAPMIYYGTEAGMWGADDPDDRKPMIWADRKYQPEKNDPLGRPRKSDAVEFDAELFRWYQKLFQIRQQESALRCGAFRTLIADDAKTIFAFERVLAAERIVVVLNNSWAENTVELPLTTTCTNLLDRRILKPAAGKTTLKLAAKSGVVLKMR